jgi:hypothetical protein
MATDNSTSIRALRHETRAHLAAVFNLLEGAPDLSKDERLTRLEQALTHLSAAAAHVVEAHGITVERDDEAHAAAKAMKANAILN